MDPMVEEQLDYGEEEYVSSQNLQYQGSGGAISALMDEEIMGEDDEYDDLYSDVNVGEGFMHSMKKSSGPPVLNGNGGLPDQKSDGSVLLASHPGALPSVSVPGVGVEGKNVKSSYGQNETDHRPTGFLPGKDFEQHGSNYLEGTSRNVNRVSDNAAESSVGDVGFRGCSLATVSLKIETEPKFSGGPISLLSESENSSVRNPPPVPQTRPPPAAAAVAENHLMMNENSRQGLSSVDNNGPTMLFVGELQWWTTDAELETVLSQYGRVKELKFFDERASGKSKGYCQVEFYESAAASACKEGMNGYLFNGRQCVVAFASPQSLRQMGAAHMNKNQTQAQLQPQGRRQMNDGTGRGGGTSYQGNDGGRNNGRAGWGRGGQGFPNRGQGGAGPIRGRGVIGAKSMVGGTAGVGASGGPYGLPGPVLGPAGGMMHPHGMMGMPFDPTYMARGGPYGGFPGPAFPGMMPSFQAMNTMGLPGVAPHVNPAFFGSGIAANGMGTLGNSGMEGLSAGMWNETNMGAWLGDEHGKGARESSYGGDDDGSDYGYGEGNHERGGRSNVPREKEKVPNRDWSGNSDRRHRDEREQGWDRSDRERLREEKDGYKENRRESDRDNSDDFSRGQPSSRSRSNSKMTQEEDHRPRTRDADYGKRRRLPSE